MMVEDMVLASIEGTLGIDDVWEHLSTVQANRTKLVGLPALVDFRRVTTALSAKELRAIAAEVRRLAKAPATRVRCAMLVDSDLHFGLVRMFEAYADGVPLSVSAFRTQDEAVHWLKHPSQS